MKFSIIGPNFQAMVEENFFRQSDGITEELITDESLGVELLTKKYLNLMHIGSPFVIESCVTDDGEQGPKLIYYPKPGDHLLIMTERQFKRLQREQMFALQQARGNR